MEVFEKSDEFQSLPFQDTKEKPKSHGRMDNVKTEYPPTNIVCGGIIIWKVIIWKYSIQSLKTADLVLLNLFMRDNGRYNIPHAP